MPSTARADERADCEDEQAEPESWLDRSSGRRDSDGDSQRTDECNRCVDEGFLERMDVGARLPVRRAPGSAPVRMLVWERVSRHLGFDLSATV